MKAGSQVRCINDKNYASVRVGEVYTVERVDHDGNLLLKGNDTGCYYEKVHFESLEKVPFRDLMAGDFAIMKADGKVVFSVPETATIEEVQSLVKYAFG